jgi:hypothetical protein
MVKGLSARSLPPCGGFFCPHPLRDADPRSLTGGELKDESCAAAGAKSSDRQSLDDQHDPLAVTEDNVERSTDADAVHRTAAVDQQCSAGCRRAPADQSAYATQSRGALHIQMHALVDDPMLGDNAHTLLRVRAKDLYPPNRDFSSRVGHFRCNLVCTTRLEAGISRNLPTQ